MKDVASSFHQGWHSMQIGSTNHKFYIKFNWAKKMENTIELLIFSCQSWQKCVSSIQKQLQSRMKHCYGMTIQHPNKDEVLADIFWNRSHRWLLAYSLVWKSMWHTGSTTSYRKTINTNLGESLTFVWVYAWVMLGSFGIF